ncbi:MAG: hydrogenase iron-sulfur subunit [Alphaproteobacteria bacterium]|nr:hydrogenase iron-sulfur subunit [Alphaproteobacteria bacterium]
MIGPRSVLRRAFDAVDRGLDRTLGPSLNPMDRLGALGFFFYWIVAVSGIYLFIPFDTGVHGAYASVERITHAQWYAGGVMRSLHRYASDAMVAAMLLHMAREWAHDRYRGVRWFSWLTGVPVLWLLYVSGITGYWLVWDKLAQYVAIASSELLDWLGVFGEPVARNFLAPDALSDRFFTLLVFMHIAVPLFLLFAMWIHLQRISRPKVNPPRALAAATLAAMLAVSLWRPALSQGPADLTTVPSEVGLDWFYLLLYPLIDLWSHGWIWGLLAAFTVMLLAMPWLPPFRRARAAEVTLAQCNGCGRCVDDCPYNAVTLVPRRDGRPFSHEAQVDPGLCAACGICMGACPTSTPFRRSSALATGIDLPERSLTWLRERVLAVTGGTKSGSGVLAFACSHAADTGALVSAGAGVVQLPCVAMMPPSLIDFVLSRELAAGVLVVGCAESGCHHRLGVAWMRERIAGARDPYLRARVPRERLATVWAGPSDAGRVIAAHDELKARLAGLAVAAPARRAVS